MSLHNTEKDELEFKMRDSDVAPCYGHRELIIFVMIVVHVSCVLYVWLCRSRAVCPIEVCKNRI
jgi:hypothetical protein